MNYRRNESKTHEIKYEKERNKFKKMTMHILKPVSLQLLLPLSSGVSHSLLHDPPGSQKQPHLHFNTNLSNS